MKVISLHLPRSLSSRVDWLVPCGSGRTICGNGDYISRLVLIVTLEVASFTMIQSSLGIEHRSIQLPWQMLSYPGTFARQVLSESPIMYPLPPHAVVVVLVRLKPSERVLLFSSARSGLAASHRWALIRPPALRSLYNSGTPRTLA